MRVVIGDLSQPRLGLSRAQLESIAGSVDAICHAGADVNWVCRTTVCAPTNVRGTRELLDLAAPRALPFHFVSSLSVCCSTDAPERVDERYDALPHLSGVHLGYAQTKVVAEALVLAAQRRGLPVSIYRPSFISGHSGTGAFNGDDLLARLISGCVRMGTAPDLDWRLDCLPVDVVARNILRLSDRRGVFHLAHAAPRHWRECVLWMRAYGYTVRLVPYHAWLRQLEIETAKPADGPPHPLRPLRSFFLNRPAAAGGLTLPELHEESRRSHVSSAMTDRHLASNAARPALDAELLERYFDAFVADGRLPAPAVFRPLASAPGKGASGSLTPDDFTALLGTRVCAAEPLGRISAHSIVSELTAWRARQPTGLFRYRLRVRAGARFPRSERRRQGQGLATATRSRSATRWRTSATTGSERRTRAGPIAWASRSRTCASWRSTRNAPGRLKSTCQRRWG